MTEPPDGLSIGDLARHTDVPVATLRSWEDRYGFRDRTAAAVTAVMTGAMSISSRPSCARGPLV